MSVSGVCGSADWAAAQQAMGTSQAGGAQRSCGDGDCHSGRTHEGHHGHRSHHGHHGRHGGFVQAIRQVLDQLVAQAAGAASDATATDATDAVTTDAAVADAPVTDTAATDAMTTDAMQADATDAAATETGPSRWQIRHALHAFIHTLFQTLAGAPAAGTDADGDDDGSTAPTAMGRFAYGTPNMDLATLATGATSDDTSSGMDLGALQESFQTLLDALGAGDSGITLQSFLQALLDHLGGAAAPATDPPGTGTLVEVSA